MTHHASVRVEEKGSAFFVVTILAVTATVLVGAYLSTSLGKVRHVELQAAESSAFHAAESGLNALVQRLWTLYRQAPPSTRLDAIRVEEGELEEDERFVFENRAIGGSDVSARVRDVRIVGSQYADVEIVSTGRNRQATRTILAVVRFGRRPSHVFNYAYFINNFGWLWGSTITVNGDVRSNGNFSMRYATVNGDIHASENEDLGAAGTVSGTSYHRSIEDYNATTSTRARPTNPSGEFEYTGGYDGDSERFEQQAPIDMPYLGDLSIYRELATSKGGKLSQGGAVLVDGVLGDDAGEPDNLLVVGTEADPIVVDGPVVIESDVVLRGVITGRGTIYAGRNVHIIGDLAYASPPEWPKPLEDPEAAKEANRNRDLVGLAAKGSIVLGDYTQDWWKSATGYYQRPPFTQAYVVDESDAANGYVSQHDPQGRPVFDGDYTDYDGGTKTADDGAGTVSRRYYESSLSDAAVHAAAEAGYLERVDAILYTNHLLSGRTGQCSFNGTLVSRDEAIIYSGAVEMNHDVRVRDDGYEYIDIFLPREPTYRVLYWSEGGEGP